MNYHASTFGLPVCSILLDSCFVNISKTPLAKFSSLISLQGTQFRLVTHTLTSVQLSNSLYWRLTMGDVKKDSFPVKVISRDCDNSCGFFILVWKLVTNDRQQSWKTLRSLVQFLDFVKCLRWRGEIITYCFYCFSDIIMTFCSISVRTGIECVVPIVS